MKHRGKIAVCAALLTALLACAAIFYPKDDPENFGNDTRLVATAKVRVVGLEDLPLPIGNEGDGSRVWAIRREAREHPFNESMIAAITFLVEIPKIIEHYARNNSLPENLVLAELGIMPASSPRMAPMLAQDGGARLFAAGEAMNMFDSPLSWHVPENLVAAYTPLRVPRALKPMVEAAPAPAKPKIVHYPRGASHYRELVENFSRRYNLSTELVMAIIHSESDFRPSLVSSKSAMGLMQLLPTTASGEVHRFLYGRRGQVSYEQLSVPEINIRYGTAYLHILLNRYFQNVADERVREYCAIASYNLGPNRFLRLYGPTNELAVARINSMGPEEFYNDLSTRLPTRETRHYVEKVRRIKARYATQ